MWRQGEPPDPAVSPLDDRRGGSEPDRAVPGRIVASRGIHQDAGRERNNPRFLFPADAGLSAECQECCFRAGTEGLDVSDVSSEKACDGFRRCITETNPNDLWERALHQAQLMEVGILG